MLTFLACLIVGALVGYYERDIRVKLAELYIRTKPQPTPEVGATVASYGTVNEYAGNQSSEIGISEAKSPALLEWEEKQRLEQAQLNVIVKPRS